MALIVVTVVFVAAAVVAVRPPLRIAQLRQHGV